MRALTWARQLLRSERGNVLAIGAAVMPLMIGAAAVGLDTIQLSLWKRQLQRMADSAALAGAHSLVQRNTPSGQAVAEAAVARDRELNDQLGLLTGYPIVQSAPAAGPYAGNAKAVRVILSAKRDLPFWRFFQGESPTVTVEATAAIVQTGSFCILTLEEGAVRAINFTGNANVNLGCGIATNSTAVPAIDAGGSSTLTANPIMARGGLDATNDYYGNSTLIPYSDKQQDPFADRPDPSTAANAMSCDDAFDDRASVTLDETVPGSASVNATCFSSMTINRSITLPAGTYYIKNGNLNLGPHATVTGTGVTIIFTGDGDSIGKIEMNGQASMTLSAPETGPYRDIVIFRDDDRLTMDDMHLNGGNQLNLLGALYMPKTNIVINGNSSMTSTCLQIVSQRISFSGNMNLSNSLTDSCRTKPGENFTLSQVRLVG
jgi:Flp pilus assembly protein TadG